MGMQPLRFTGRVFLTQFQSTKEASHQGYGTNLLKGQLLLGDPDVLAEDGSESRPVLLNDEEDTYHFTAFQTMDYHIFRLARKARRLQEQGIVGLAEAAEEISLKNYQQICRDFGNPDQLNTAQEIEDYLVDYER